MNQPQQPPPGYPPQPPQGLPQQPPAHPRQGHPQPLPQHPQPQQYGAPQMQQPFPQQPHPSAQYGVPQPHPAANDSASRSVGIVFGILIILIAIYPLASAISNFPSHFSDYNPETGLLEPESSLGVALAYIIYVLRVLGGVSLVATGVLLIMRSRITTYAGIASATIPILTWMAYAIDGLRTVDKYHTELVYAIYSFPLLVNWGVGLIVMGIIFLPPVRRALSRRTPVPPAPQAHPPFQQSYPPGRWLQ